jgi:CheY-like chemotaxis protein
MISDIKRFTILLVDDREPDRKLIKEALLNEGCYDIIEAGDGEEALKLFMSGKYKIDLILSDILMPRMDGVGLVERVREASPKMKVIFISGYERKFEQSSIKGQKVDIISKSYDLKYLVEKVRETLSEPTTLGQWIKKRTSLILMAQKKPE